MNKNKFIKNLNYRKIALVIILLGVISLVIWGWGSTHAFYNSNSEIKIFSATIGNFASGGDTSPLEKNTDINVLYYVQDIIDSKKYAVSEHAPLEIKNYKLDEEKSNCIPKTSTSSGDKVTYKEDYSIDEATGAVKITITEDKPHQVVCRIYYSFDLEEYAKLNGDIKVISLVEATEGTLVATHGNKAYTLQDVPASGYDLTYYECTNSSAQTKPTLTYENGKLKAVYEEPDLCYAYFDRK